MICAEGLHFSAYYITSCYILCSSHLQWIGFFLHTTATIQSDNSLTTGILVIVSLTFAIAGGIYDNRKREGNDHSYSSSSQCVVGPCGFQSNKIHNHILLQVFKRC